MKVSRHAHGLRGRTDGRTGDGWALQARAAGGERRPAAGRNRPGGSGGGWRRASQNRDVTLGAWLTNYDDGRTGGRVQAIPPQSGVTACKL